MADNTRNPDQGGNQDDQRVRQTPQDRDRDTATRSDDEPGVQSSDATRSGQGDQGEKYGGGAQIGKPGVGTTQGDRGGTS